MQKIKVKSFSKSQISSFLQTLHLPDNKELNLDITTPKHFGKKTIKPTSKADEQACTNLQGMMDNANEEGLFEHQPELKNKIKSTSSSLSYKTPSFYLNAHLESMRKILNTSILLQRLEFESKIFPQDYKFEAVKVQINEYKQYENDDRLLHTIANSNSKDKKNTTLTIPMENISLAKSALQTSDSKSKLEVIQSVEIIKLLNPIFFNGMRCKACHEPKGINCTKCHIVSYCSIECEDKDRTQHKAECCIFARHFAEEKVKLMKAYKEPKDALFLNLNVAQHILNHYFMIETDLLIDDVPIVQMKDSTDAQVSSISLLRSWLVNFSPCTLLLKNANDQIQTTWITEYPEKTKCIRCHKNLQIFCRKCSFWNYCATCSFKFHDVEECSLNLNMINQLVKKLVYSRNSAKIVEKMEKLSGQKN